MKAVDALLKAMLVFSRTVDQVLEMRAVEAAAKTTLSSSKVQILRLLGQRGGQTSTQVARYLSVSKPAVTQIVDALVRSKLVVRKTAKEDRREVILTLTKKGRDLFQSIRQFQRQYIRLTLKDAFNGNVEQWVASLYHVSESLAKADQSYKHFCAQCGAHEDGNCVLIGGDSSCPFLAQTAKAQRRRIKAKAE